jgi:hypothetical protein
MLTTMRFVVCVLLSVSFLAVVCAPLRAQDETRSPTPSPAPAPNPTPSPTTSTQDLNAQDTTTAPHTGPGRFYYGFRVEDSPLRLFRAGSASSSTTQPIADYQYSADSSSQKFALAASLERQVTRRWSGTIEFYLTHAKFTQSTEVRTGVPSPNSTKDDRPVTTYAETSKANYWVVPALARYQSIWPHGFLSHVYFTGGLEYRHVGRVRSGTDITYPDGSTGYTEVAVVPVHSNQVGIVGGLGLRFLDEVGIKVTPELRYIYWNSDTFRGPGYASVRDQAEISLGFSF